MPQTWITKAIGVGAVALAGMGVVWAAEQEPPKPSSAPVRLLVKQVQLLQPSEQGIHPSEPVDVLLVDGKVAAVGTKLDVQLQPGEVMLRGQGKWLLPAPPQK